MEKQKHYEEYKMYRKPFYKRTFNNRAEYTKKTNIKSSDIIYHLYSGIK